MNLLGHFSPSIPIHIHELQSKGLWDIERYTRKSFPALFASFLSIFLEPYITEHYLRSKFGNYFDDVVGNYFHRIGDGRYALQEYLSTEKKILVYAYLFVFIYFL